MGLLDDLPSAETNLSSLSERVKSLPPQKAAGILSLSRKFNEPADVIAGNYEAYLGGVSDTIDWDALKKTAPKTAEFMSDPYHMAIYRDKARRLEEIEGSWKVWRAAREGFRDVGRASLGFLAGKYESDVNRENTVVSDFDQTIFTTPKPSKPIEATTLNKWIESDTFRAREVKGDTAVGQWGLDVVRAIPQFAAQAAVYALTGGIGSMAFMGTQIAGGQYLKLKQDGVDAETAFQAALTNAVLQAPMEQFSFAKIAKKIPAGSSRAFKAREIIERGLTESITEWAQAYPEAATELWAKNQGKSVQELAGMYADDIVNITKEGMYQGLVAAPFGFLGGAIRIKTQEAVTQAFVKQIETTRQQIIKSELLGASPEATAAHIDAVTDSKQVFLDPAGLEVLYQSANPDEVANALGVTVEQYQTAVETGEMIPVPLSRYTVATAENPDFKILDQHIAETEEGFTSAQATERKNQEDVRRTTETIKKENEALKTEVERLTTEAREAGATAEQAKAIVSVVVKNARVMAKDPAKWLRDKVTFTKGLAPAQGSRQRVNPDGTPVFFQSDYRGTHTAPTKKDGEQANPLHDITTVYPDDVYSSKASLYYGHGNRAIDDLSARIIQQFRHSPNKKITVYRAIPKGVDADINIGDWVTINPQYAKMHGEHALNGNYKIIKKAVYARDIFTDGNSLHEWGYDPQPEVNKEEIAAMKTRPKMYQTAAWHGSPHTVDKFTTQKIGTGEGAQAYGWGMYFSSSKKVAEWYRDTVADKRRAIEVAKYHQEKITYWDQFKKQFPEKAEEFADELYEAADRELDSQELAAELSNVFYRNEKQKLQMVSGDIAAFIVENYTPGPKFPEFKQSEKRLYDVALTPDEHEFLDWDYQMMDQSTTMRELLLKVEPSIWDDLKGEGTTGRDLYKEIIKAKGSPEAASRYLFSLGIPGITYKGNASGERNFVVFDDSHVQINAMYQSYKGSIHWQDGRAIISLFETADASTLIHETVGHYFTESLMIEGSKEDAPDWMQQDRQTVLNYVGLESWESATPEQRVEAHEKMARSAEAYFMTGKAPSIETRGMFRRFKEWLLQVYKDVSQLDVNITPEIVSVFDRMLATKEEIEQVESLENYHLLLPDVVLKALPPHAVDRLDKQILKARESAEAILQGKLLENMTAERKKEIQLERNRIEQEMRASVDDDPLYSALREMNLPMTQDEKQINQLLSVKDGSPSALVEELKADRESMIETLARYLYKNHGDGVEQVKIFTADGDKEASFRVSQNAKWYQDYYAEFGNAPTVAETRRLAEDFLQNGFEDYAELVPPNAKYIATESAIKAAESVRDKTKGREWGGKPVDTDAARAIFTDGETAREAEILSLPDVIDEITAESLGFSSADELIKRIGELLPAEREIAAQTDDYMSAAFPDAYLNPAALRQAAQEAMYNDDGAMLAAIEKQVIQEKLTGILQAEQSRKAAQLAREQAKAYAQKVFESKTVEDALKLQSYITNERRAAEKAQNYLSKGDIAKALEYKQLQLVAHAMVQESLNARREYERINKYLKRQQKSKKATWVSQDHWQQAADILTRFGYKIKWDGRQDEPLAAYVARMTEENQDMIAIADWLAMGREAKPAKQLTLQQLKDVEGAVRNIKKMARYGVNGDSFFVIGDKGLAATSLDLVGEAEANAKDKQIDEMGEGKKAGIFAQFWHGLRKPSELLRVLDGYKDFGPWANALYYKLAEASNTESNLVEKVFSKIEAAFDAEGITKEQRYNDAHKKIYIEEWETSVTKNTLRAVLLNMGSESNLKRMLSTPPVGYRSINEWNQANVTAVLEKYLAESDFRMAQKIWDAINLYDEYTAMVKQVTGFPMVKVEPQPIIFNVNGKTIYLDGGYYPLKQDTRGSKQAELNEEKALAGGGAGLMPYPNTGASKARTKGAQYAVDYDLSNLYGAVKQTAHDIAFRPVALDINKLMRQDQIKEVLRRKLGDTSYSFITKWQNTVMRGKDSDVEGSGMFDQIAREARKRAIVANLLFRVGTVFQNAANFTLYGNAVEGFGEKEAYASFVKYGLMDYIPKALSASADAAAIREEVFSLSAMMRDKAKNPDYSLREILSRPEESVFGAAVATRKESLVRFGSRILAFSDQLTDIPMWRGAYYQALSDGKTQQEAILYADTVIDRTTGTGRTIDTSAMQRGGPTEKLLTMFQTFINGQYNRWASEFGIYLKEKDAARLISFVATKYLMFGIISAIASGKGPDDDDDLAKWFAKEVLGWPLSMIPVAGTGAKYVLDTALGFKSFGFALSPVERSIEDILKLANNSRKVIAGEKEAGELAEPAMATAAFLFGYPDQFNDWFWNAYDMMNGMEPRPSDLIRRRPKRER